MSPRRAATMLTLALALGAGAAARADGRDDPGCGTFALARTSGATLLRLPRTFLVAGRDSVWTRLGPLAIGRDVLIDRLRGEIRLLRDPAVDTVWVRTCWLLDPPPLDLQLERYRPIAAAPAETARFDTLGRAPRPGLGRDRDAPPPGAALTVTGNKTLAVDFGSAQDASLRQSLDLSVSGSLAPGVTLTGVLSDRNTPLTTEGGTQELRALDRVLIELRAPRASAALGDIGVAFSEGQFGRLERRVQGARAEWGTGGATFAGAAATETGEYHRLQRFGVEGRQGPYALTDRDGAEGVAVVAGSEIVTLDGVRMSRGESADYSIDYDRGLVTFTNRRPIGGASRITVDYQYTLRRYRRNFGAAEGRFARAGLSGYARLMNEGDDRGSPLDLALDASDRAAIAAAGDSAGRALGVGVAGGGGDYDTVRVGGALRFAFAGPDSGEFQVSFARVGAGLGDYADSATVAGRLAFRFAGAGGGAYRVGRALPLPESHQLGVAGGAWDRGALHLEFEGAYSRRDLNTGSSLDDDDNGGAAARAALRLGGKVGGPLPGDASVSVAFRSVGRRFAPFDRLERPFTQESWGLPIGADLEHQRRADVGLGFRPRAGGALDASFGALRLPDGFESQRGTLDWYREGRLTTRLALERADGRDPSRRFADGGRERAAGEVRLRLPWFEPALRGEVDERTSPGDSARSGLRGREVGADLASPRAFPWRAFAGLGLRDEAQLAGGAFVDQSRIRSLRAGLESPSASRLGASLGWTRRSVEPRANPRRARNDLASLRVRLDRGERGFDGALGLEVTSEGESRRTRKVTFVGAGNGSYDALGNFVGTGDYDLVTTVSGELDPIARAALSARAGWSFGDSERLKGSRLTFDFESEARRRGELRAADLAVSPGAVIGDAGLSRGTVLQRLEGDVAPGSAALGVRVRLERRVSGDRSFANFGQATDDRTATLRWRARAAGTFAAEVEGRTRRQEARQAFSGGTAYARVVREQGGNGQLVWTPDARLRLAAVGDLAWSRPAGAEVATRTLRLGPDLGVTIGGRGRADVQVRRAFIAGPPAVALLPGVDPAGAPRWELTARADVRVRDVTSVGFSVLSRQFEGRAARTTGRAEVRAFF